MILCSLVYDITLSYGIDYNAGHAPKPQLAFTTDVNRTQTDTILYNQCIYVQNIINTKSDWDITHIKIHLVFFINITSKSQ